MNVPHETEADVHKDASYDNKNLLNLILASINKHEEDSNEINDMNEQLLEVIQTQISQLQEEVRQKDSEIQLLLRENNNRRESIKKQTSEMRNLKDGMQERIRCLELTVEDLEGNIEESHKLNEKHLKAIESLESDNEKLREENRRQMSEIENLHEQMLKVQLNSSKSTIGQSTNIGSPSIAEHSATLRKSRISDPLRRRRVSRYDSPRQDGEFFNLESTIMDANQLSGTGKGEEHWFNQIENLKEKLSNEQNKTRDLTFLVTNLKNANEFLTQENNTVYSTKSELESKVHSLKEECKKLNEIKIKEKVKLDTISAFCGLLDQCDFTGGEVTQKLVEVPSAILEFINGSSKTLQFKSFLSHKDLSVIGSGSDGSLTRQKSAQSIATNQICLTNRSCNSIPEDMPRSEDIKFIYKDMEDLKETMGQMLKSINRLNRAKDHSDKSALKKLESFEDLSPHSDTINQFNLTESPQKGRTKTTSSSFYLSKAIRNSHSLLWNLRRKTEINAEEDIDSLKQD